MAGAVAYNPSDAEQRELLAAIRAVEGTSAPNSYSVGFGYKDLSGASRDQYGFPQWAGSVTSRGPTHAAGAYQFQPGTWREVASRYGLNFANPGDQDAGAWYNAQAKYAARTGGRSLDADLDAGLYDRIRAGLQSEWEGILTKPSQFLSILSDGVVSEVSPGATDTSGTPSFFTSPIQAASAYFVRGGMILVGGLILLVALWALLSKSNVLPGAISMGK